MKKIVLPLASVALVVLLSSGISGSMPTGAQAITVKPNIVFILADDMRKDDLTYMPQTRSLLAAKGMSFENAFVSNGLCCPSRATIMRGQYAHNTGVWLNGGPDEGGWRAYRSNGLEQDNVATRLDAAGYRTGLFGKYLNSYSNTTVIPPGWDHWFATFHPPWEYFDYDVNDNGTMRHFGTRDSDYQTDVLKRDQNVHWRKRQARHTLLRLRGAPGPTRADHLRPARLTHLRWSEGPTSALVQ